MDPKCNGFPYCTEGEMYFYAFKQFLCTLLLFFLIFIIFSIKCFKISCCSFIVVLFLYLKFDAAYVKK